MIVTMINMAYQILRSDCNFSKRLTSSKPAINPTGAAPRWNPLIDTGGLNRNQNVPSNIHKTSFKKYVPSVSTIFS